MNQYTSPECGSTGNTLPQYGFALESTGKPGLSLLTKLLLSQSQSGLKGILDVVTKQVSKLPFYPVTERV
jgi:hypothetical protein